MFCDTNEIGWNHVFHSRLIWDLLGQTGMRTDDLVSPNVAVEFILDFLFLYIYLLSGLPEKVALI